MTQKLILSDLSIIKDQLFKFVWTFKVGDNILYNFEILRELYNAKGISKKNTLNKPITITIVSIIEAILVDFIERIGIATTHKPANIDPSILINLKKEIREDRVKKGNYYKRKLYGFKEIIKILRKYELFGEKGDEIYVLLNIFSDMRNRVHIENYYDLLEEDEINVFTPSRLSEIERVLYLLWNKMVSDYQRPWKNINN